MKRLNPTDVAILEAQTLITYLERKLMHKKQRLLKLQKHQQYDDMVNAVCHPDDGPVLFLDDGELRYTMDRAIARTNEKLMHTPGADVILTRAPATLVFKFDKGATGSSRITALRMTDVCARLPVLYENYNARWLEQEIITELTPYASSDKEFEFSVLIYRVMPAAVARKFMRGPYDVLIARQLTNMASEENRNDFTREVDTGGGDHGITCTGVDWLDEYDEASPLLGEKEWKRKFAWKSPASKLWYCKRTAELLGKPTTGEF